MTLWRSALAAILTVSLLLGAAGCIRPYQITIQQGNVITQDMIDQLKPGMTREQVAFVMGEPVMRNTFDSDRWDYVYTIDVPRAFKRQVLVSLHFSDDLLSHITGDMAPTAAKPETLTAN